MSVGPVRKVRCIGHAAERGAFVSLLQDLGIIELVDFREAHPDEALAPFLGKEEPEAREAESRLSDLEFLVEYLSRFAEKPGTLRKVEVTPRELQEVEREDLTPIAGRCRELERRQGQLAAQLTQLESLAKGLEPWRDLPIPLGELRDTARARVWAGVFPPDRAAEFRRRMEEASIPCHVELLRGAAGDPAVVVALREDGDRVLEALREIEFADASFPGIEGRPAEELLRLGERCRAIEAEREEIVAESRRLSREVLQRALVAADLARDLADRRKAPALFAATRSAFVAEGWVLAKDLARIREGVGSRLRTVSVAEVEPEPGEEPPSHLENPPAVEPFELVTDLYGRPKPKEIDPTPFLAPFFALFFALCLTDAGYGFVLAALMAGILWKARLESGSKRLVKLLLIAGIATVAAGIATGGYFGVAAPFKLFDPIEDALVFFSLALACGGIHVALGFALKWHAAWRAGDRLGGTMQNAPWIVVSLALAVVMIHNVNPLPAPVAAAAMGTIWPWGILAVFLLSPGTVRHPIQRILSGLGAVYGVVGIFGDILSYSRLLALGLATAVIAAVINEVGGLFLKIPVAGILVLAIFLVVAHLAYIAISCLGAFVHTSRLTFVEFFSKFYAGGGRPFSPFRRKRQYIIVTGEDHPGG